MDFAALNIPLLLLVLLLAVGIPAWLGLCIRRALQHTDEPDAPPPDGETPAEPGFIDSVPALNPVHGPAAHPPTGPLVTVAAFGQPHEAHLARLRLEQHDIPAFVADENLIGMDWFYSLAAGGVKVQVPESVAEEAQRLLHDEPSEALHDAEPMEEPEPEPDDDPAAPRCPLCGSTEAYRVRRFRGVVYLSLLLFNFPLPLSGTRMECGRCGAQWKADARR